MYNVNHKPLLYNKIHSKHPAKSHPPLYFFVRKSAQSPRLKIFYFLHFLPICNDILQQVNHCIFTFLHYMDDYWVIFYVLTHINQKIYLFYNQIVVYLHNEDKEHRYTDPFFLCSFFNIAGNQLCHFRGQLIEVCDV